MTSRNRQRDFAWLFVILVLITLVSWGSYLRLQPTTPLPRPAVPVTGHLGFTISKSAYHYEFVLDGCVWRASLGDRSQTGVLSAEGASGLFERLQAAGVHELQSGPTDVGFQHYTLDLIQPHTGPLQAEFGGPLNRRQQAVLDVLTDSIVYHAMQTL